MNIAIGFGSTEKSFEDAEEQAFREYAMTEFKAQGLNYFTKDFFQTLNKWLQDRTSSLKEAANVHDKEDSPPPRYSYYRAYLIDDANYMIAVAKFMHINRRHALSPDGWGLMQTERLFKVALSEIPLPSEDTHTQPVMGEAK